MATAFSRSPSPSDAMTARLVVMMTLTDKQALEQRAREFNMTPSDFVRRASENYDPRVDEAIFEAFLTEFEETNRAMCATLKASNDSIDATRAEMLALRAAHQAR